MQSKVHFHQKLDLLVIHVINLVAFKQEFPFLILVVIILRFVTAITGMACAPKFPSISSPLENLLSTLHIDIRVAWSGSAAAGTPVNIINLEKANII